MAELNAMTNNWMFALAGGIIPALLWLWFWLQEDRLHPEPRGRIWLAFWGGMLAVALVYYPERYIFNHFGSGNTTYLLWAAIEEVAKLLMAYLLALRSRAFDEPIDAIEYMITVALGFAALENALFILNPLIDGNLFAGVVTTNMRFIGASLLHVVTSGILGFCIAKEFYDDKISKFLWMLLGLAAAVALHTVFNMFIIYENGEKTFLVFACVWAAVIVILLLFEKIKKLKQ